MDDRPNVLHKGLIVILLNVIDYAPGLSNVSPVLFAACWVVGIHMMAEICQRVLDGFGMPVEWALGIVFPIFKGKFDIRNCSCYGAVRFIEHDVKVVERVIEKILLE